MFVVRRLPSIYNISINASIAKISTKLMPIMPALFKINCTKINFNKRRGRTTYSLVKNIANSKRGILVNTLHRARIGIKFHCAIKQTVGIMSTYCNLVATQIFPFQQKLIENEKKRTKYHLAFVEERTYNRFLCKNMWRSCE